MTPEERARLLGVLEAARKTTRRAQATRAGELAQLLADRGTETADDEHDPEGATLSAEWAMRHSVHRTIERETAEIDDAIRRWHDGTYGVCASCGDSIRLARLEARPTATLCIACASTPDR